MARRTARSGLWRPLRVATSFGGKPWLLAAAVAALHRRNVQRERGGQRPGSKLQHIGARANDAERGVAIVGTAGTATAMNDSAGRARLLCSHAGIKKRTLEVRVGRHRESKIAVFQVR